MSSVFSFLIATDIHLGYDETNRITGDDSFVTFEEILLKAVDGNVDIILLGGDLFHHNNPSQKCMNKCMELLRRYTFGDKPVYFELLSNAREVFSNSISETTNYLDDNINVSIPVFSIHGNHDDPSGVGHFSALDTLSSAGLVNYFGKWTDLEEVIIKPILLRKGKTKVALYGLSHIKDDRLCRLFIAQQVKFVRPDIDPDGWFNIFILHQNRVDRGPKRYIAETYIPEFMDLVIWGHEHDCEIEPLKNLEKGFYVIQPGSSVATSLSEGESLPKHVANLQIFEKKMKVTPLRLNSVRPLIWRTEKLWGVNVSSEKREIKSEEIKTHCMQVVEEMIRESEEKKTGHPKQPTLPLIRLRCEYSDETQLFNVVKFGQIFQGRVANPNAEIIRLKRTTIQEGKKNKSEDIARLNALYKEDMEEAHNFTACVNHIVKDYFTNHESTKMLIMKVSEMAEAVEKFIDKDELTAIEELVEKKIEKVLKELKQQKVNCDETNMIELFERMRDEDEKFDLKEEKDFQKKFEHVTSKEKRSASETEKRVGNDGGSSSSTDDEFFGGKNKSVKTSKTIDLASFNSDTDEYDAGNAVDSAKRKQKSKGSSDSSDDGFFKDKANGKSSEGKDHRKPRGRGRGAQGKRGRGRATTAETTQNTLRAYASTSRSKITNSLTYEDSDSD